MRYAIESCPICQREMQLPFQALSRFDNVTMICPKCGEAEALIPFSNKAIGAVMMKAKEDGMWPVWAYIVREGACEWVRE